MPSQDTDDGYAVYWPNGDRNTMTSAELGQLPIDPASWLNFTRYLFKQRPFAPMTLHNGNTRQVLRVIAQSETGRYPTYQSFD